MGHEVQFVLVQVFLLTCFPFRSVAIMGRKRKSGGKPESSRKGKPEGDADSGTKETVEETVEYTLATDPPVPEQADVRPSTERKSRSEQKTSQPRDITRRPRNSNLSRENKGRTPTRSRPSRRVESR